MFARFFMFTQLYFHPVRRIYDIHLKDFLIQTLQGGKYPSTVNEHLEITDNEVTASILKVSRDLSPAPWKGAQLAAIALFLFWWCSGCTFCERHAS